MSDGCGWGEDCCGGNPAGCYQPGEAGQVVHLSDRRPPVIYSLTIAHHWDDTVEVTVHDVQDDPRSRAEVRRTFARLASRWLTPEDVHALLLAMVDARMGEAERSPERTKELRALANACAAYEAVMHPLDASQEGGEP